MKQKFYDGRRQFGFFSLFLGLTMFSLGIWLAWGHAMHRWSNIGEIWAPLLAAFMLLILGGTFIFYGSNEPFSVLIVDANMLILKRFLRKTIRMDVSQINHIFVGDDIGARDKVRFSFSFICFSAEFVDPRQQRRVVELKCHPGFIKQMYSDELYQAIVEILPEEKCAQLKAYYNHVKK